jgi:hypothetical protein
LSSIANSRSLNRNEGYGDERESKLNHGDNKKSVKYCKHQARRKKTKRVAGQSENGNEHDHICTIRTGTTGSNLNGYSQLVTVTKSRRKNPHVSGNFDLRKAA